MQILSFKATEEEMTKVCVFSEDSEWRRWPRSTDSIMKIMSVIFSHDFRKGLLKTGSGKLSFLKKSRHSYKRLFGTQKTSLLTPNFKKILAFVNKIKLPLTRHLPPKRSLRHILNNDQAQISYNMYKTKQKIC